MSVLQPAMELPVPRRRRLDSITQTFRRYPVVSGFLLLVVIGMAVFAGVLQKQPPNAQLLVDRYQPPFWVGDGSWDHPLGTDGLGRDVFSRAIHGARVSMLVAGVSILIGTAAGTLVALLAGNWHRSWIDTTLMRITDAMLSIPLVLAALLFAVAVGASFGMVVTIIALFIWARTARIVRTEVLEVNTRDFVTFARLSGASNLRIITRHLLPNISHVAIVMATLEVGNVIILEASLGFLGVGVPPPDPSWGGMVAEGRSQITSAWWLVVVPGVMIMITVVSLNFLGDWLRDRLDPRLRTEV
ncbi:MAG TPA: ABC transporter permease [Acidimicrobiales bacterium]|nr:ABC transporter permease [Acidimicrobiales bacterium]